MLRLITVQHQTAGVITIIQPVEIITHIQGLKDIKTRINQAQTAITDGDIINGL